MKYGIQMYSLRDITEKDLDGALKAVADMGYHYIEFAGFFGHSAEEVRGYLEKYGLEIIATHSGWTDLRDNFEETVRYHKALGNKNYIIPGADLSTKAKLDEFIDFINEVQPKLKAEGIDLGYHNHSHEFIPNDDGCMIHKEIEKRTDMFFELDTYWAFVAKLDPVKELDRLADRVKLIHLKDGTAEGKGLSLGSGEAPVAAVRNKAVQMNLGIVVESEGCSPTGREEVKRCIDYLNTLD